MTILLCAYFPRASDSQLRNSEVILRLLFGNLQTVHGFNVELSP